MGLEIRQTYAQIGIDRTPSRLDIWTQASRLELHQNHAKVNIRTELPKVLIDQTQCFAEAGLKNDLERAKEASGRAYQQAMEFIAKYAADGDRLAAIESGGQPLADIAERDAFPEHEFGLTFIPKSRPEISVTGSVQIEPERNAEGANNGVEGSYTPPEMNISYTPAEINIYMRQYASINFSYKGNTIDEYR